MIERSQACSSPFRTSTTGLSTVLTLQLEHITIEELLQTFTDTFESQWLLYCIFHLWTIDVKALLLIVFISSLRWQMFTYSLCTEESRRCECILGIFRRDLLALVVAAKKAGRFVHYYDTCRVLPPYVHGALKRNWVFEGKVHQGQTILSFARGHTSSTWWPPNSKYPSDTGAITSIWTSHASLTYFIGGVITKLSTRSWECKSFELSLVFFHLIAISWCGAYQIGFRATCNSLRYIPWREILWYFE